jgi:hypothetical protein
VYLPPPASRAVSVSVATRVESAVFTRRVAGRALPPRCLSYANPAHPPLLQPTAAEIEATRFIHMLTAPLLPRFHFWQTPWCRYRPHHFHRRWRAATPAAPAMYTAGSGLASTPAANFCPREDEPALSPPHPSRCCCAACPWPLIGTRAGLKDELQSGLHRCVQRGFVLAQPVEMRRGPGLSVHARRGSLVWLSGGTRVWAQGILPCFCRWLVGFSSSYRVQPAAACLLQ